MPCFSVYCTIALPIGCSECCSQLPIMRKMLSSVSFACSSSVPADTFLPFSLLKKSVTAGLPSVIVPVLSNTSVSILCASSRLEASLISIPASAARPVPTIIAVGVASPNAHGHAITKTATAEISAILNG